MSTKQINPDLTDEQKHVLFGQGTERAYSGKYLKHDAEGMYTCVNCGQALFSSDTKFTAPYPNQGWPSFSDLASNDAVKLTDDKTLGMHRTEVTCSKCGAHLGHLFDDGPKEVGGKHYCINSVCLAFNPTKNQTS